MYHFQLCSDDGKNLICLLFSVQLYILLYCHLKLYDNFVLSVSVVLSVFCFECTNYCCFMAVAFLL